MFGLFSLTELRFVPGVYGNRSARARTSLSLVFAGSVRDCSVERNPLAMESPRLDMERVRAEHFTTRYCTPARSFYFSTTSDAS